ncbi:hypothetical protein D3C85_549210 [compost metagenome]
MGGAKDAHVDHHFLLAAHGTNGFLLDGAQQLDLHGQWQVGHLIEEQGAAIGRLEQALLVFHRAGEAALLVAEELAFHQLGRNGAAVDRHEGPVGARSLFMDQSCHQFLAAAGFAADVDGGLAAGEFLDLLAQGIHWRRAALQAAVHRRFAILRRAQAQGGVDQFAQAAEVDRLGQEVESAGLEGVHRGVEAAIGRDHRHRNQGMALLDVLNQLQSGAVGQAHIGQAQVEGLASQPFARFLEIARAAGVELHPPEGDLQQFADIGLVVDDQGSLSGHGQLSLRGWAKVMRKQLPPCSRGL